jgi:trimethylamine--corrinoid protein Co-methyltransferase
METMMNTLTSLLSRSNVVHDPGFMDHGNLVSPELVLVINEALDMLKVFRKGIRVDEETLALDVIKEVGPSGHYLNHKHTLDHFKEIWYSEYMDRSIAGNVVTVNEKINTRTREIIENYAPKPLADDELKLVQETEKKWVRIIG